MRHRVPGELHRGRPASPGAGIFGEGDDALRGDGDRDGPPDHVTRHVVRDGVGVHGEARVPHLRQRIVGLAHDDAAGGG